MNRMPRRFRRAQSFAVLCLALVSWTWCLSVEAGSWQEEQALDKAVGILDHPWKVGRIDLRTRDRLQLGARIRTGLPSYDQQAERAQSSPASLLEEPTTTPVVQRTERTSEVEETTPEPEEPSVRPPVR